MSANAMSFGMPAFVLGLMLAVLAANDSLLHAAESDVAGFQLPAEGPDLDTFQRVNQLRSKRNLRPLLHHEALSRLASAHARDLAERNYLDHVNRSGANPLDRAQRAGIQELRLLAENIGSSSAHQSRVGEILKAWLHSPLHRENLLNPAFNRTGIGSALAPDGRTVVVQLYATFKSAH